MENRKIYKGKGLNKHQQHQLLKVGKEYGLTEEEIRIVLYLKGLSYDNSYSEFIARKLKKDSAFMIRKLRKLESMAFLISRKYQKRVLYKLSKKGVEVYNKIIDVVDDKEK